MQRPADIVPHHSVRIRLYPAAGTDYDLYVYCDNCTSSQQISNNGGSTMDEVIMAWDEDCIFGFPTGSESGRDVYIQVRYFSADICGNWLYGLRGHDKCRARGRYSSGATRGKNDQCRGPAGKPASGFCGPGRLASGRVTQAANSA